MSTHSLPFLASGGAISEAIAQLPSAIDFLPADAAYSFSPVNSDRSWASSGAKRGLDLILALPLLVLLAPLMAAIALLIRLESKGPALFRQTRNGICERPFQILKFRTMHVAEDGAEVVQARASDPRITRLGRFLRRYSLDELPQLFNVVSGEMSLVGPRPHAQVHDTHYQGLIAAYGHRFAVKPGMTGWAQIHGHRGPTPTVAVMAARIRHDVFYVREAGLLLDLKILLRTPLAIVLPRNAV
ncbi:MAG: sugar transferase [Rhizomicrobium sp.]|nr:sugar transferase [Rhizomicrobium sp.]